jgi:hypothetical protein
MDTSTGGRLLKTIEAAGDVTLERALVGIVNCRDVHLERSAAGPIAASGQVSILNGGCGPMMAGGDVSITNGGCGPLVAKGDVSITNGGTQSILAAGSARIGKGAFVGLVAAPKVEVEEGATVLMSTPQALAFGAALGTMVGLMVRGRRRAR